MSALVQAVGSVVLGLVFGIGLAVLLGWLAARPPLHRDPIEHFDDKDDPEWDRDR